MKVTGIVPRGYCKGVIHAINIVKETIEQPGPITVLGMIVHNQFIVDALKKRGAITIEDASKTRMELLDEINEGTVIITAHGAGDCVIEKAKSKGLNVVDATCLDVIKTHTLIKEQLKRGKDVLYIGKKNHPEAEGALLIDPEHIHLITSKKDLETLDKDKHYVMTNQTTMSLYDVYDLCEYAKEILDVEIMKETCSATQIRQEAIAKMDEDVDLVIIVGDPHSNNTKKLASISTDKAHKETHMIGSLEELDLSWLKGKKHVAVSSGASTPTVLTNQIIDFLKQYDENNPDSFIKPEIPYEKML